MKVTLQSCCAKQAHRLICPFTQKKQARAAFHEPILHQRITVVVTAVAFLIIVVVVKPLVLQPHLGSHSPTEGIELPGLYPGLEPDFQRGDIGKVRALCQSFICFIYQPGKGL